MALLILVFVTLMIISTHSGCRDSLNSWEDCEEIVASVQDALPDWCERNFGRKQISSSRLKKWAWTKIKYKCGKPMFAYRDSTNNLQQGEIQAPKQFVSACLRVENTNSRPKLCYVDAESTGLKKPVNPPSCQNGRQVASMNGVIFYRPDGYGNVDAFIYCKCLAYGSTGDCDRSFGAHVLMRNELEDAEYGILIFI